MKRIKVGILFGGKSAEHEVSLQSVINIFDAIDRKKYIPIPIGIEKTGKWVLFNNEDFLLNKDDPKRIKLKKSYNYITLSPESKGKLVSLSTSEIIEKIDIIFPVLHGPFGEDGTVQGVFKISNIPFVGASILGSAVGMDKEIMKHLLSDSNIPIAKFLTVREEGDIPKYEDIKKEIGIPCFLKPCNMGSSVGVSKVKNKEGYIKAVKDAFLYDRKILIEEYIKGREIECSVLGNENPIASTIGEIIPQDEFYSYDAKYIDEDGAILQIPSKLDKKKIKEIQDIAIKTFKTLSCEGLARVDMFIRENGQVIVNEINTIPGFTKISMYPKLWEVSGLSYTDLITRLIELGIERFRKEKELKTSYI